MMDPIALRHRLRSFTPAWLLRFHVGRSLFALGALADATLELAYQGMLARFPGAGTPTALSRIGRDRGMRRGLAEPAEAYAARLVGARSDAKTLGNPYTLMRRVRASFFPLKPRMRVVNANGTWYTLNTDDTRERHVTLPTPNWDWDGSATKLSRAWLIIYSTGAEAPWQRDGTWGDGVAWSPDPSLGTWGSTATLEQVEDIRAMIREAKSAGALYEKIIVAFDDDAFDPTDTSPPLPDGTWAKHSKNVGGVQVPARDSRAIYWRGAA